jgi:hypothetical protein
MSPASEESMRRMRSPGLLKNHLNAMRMKQIMLSLEASDLDSAMEKY